MQSQSQRLLSGSVLALARRLMTIAAPMMLTQLGMMGFGVVDTLMLGRVGIEALDAAALANVWLWGTMIMTFGVLLGLDPIIAHANGRGDGARAGLALQSGLIVAALISVPLMLSTVLTEDVLVLLRQDPSLAADAEQYLIDQAWSFPPMLGYMTLRQYLQGREIVAPALWVTLIANLFNAAGNELLIFGHFEDSLGIPAMGLRGAALATGITRSLLFVGLVAWTWWGRFHVGAWQPWSRAAFEWARLAEIFKYGLPVGVQYLLEVWAFQFSTLIAGDLGPEHLAAHTITLNVASVTFMLPLGISFGATTVIGNLLGSGKRDEAQQTAWLALAMGGGVMVLAAISLVLARGFIPRLYTDEVEVLLLAGSILPIAGAFQVFDGLQVVGGAILRGMGDTRPAAVFNLIGYYALALPLAFWLVYVRGGGLVELWLSLLLGLAVVAISLLFWVRVRGPAKRGSIEDERVVDEPSWRTESG